MGAEPVKTIEYIIKKGKHYSNKSFCPPYVFVGKRHFYWQVIFSLSSWYEKGGDSDYYDLNKLLGICYGFDRAEGSLRIAWLPDFDEEGKIDLYSYSYQKSNRKDIVTQKLGSVDVGEVFEVEFHRFDTYIKIVIFRAGKPDASITVNIDTELIPIFTSSGIIISLTTGAISKLRQHISC